MKNSLGNFNAPVCGVMAEKMGVVFQETFELLSLLFSECVFPIGLCARRKFAAGGIEFSAGGAIEVHENSVGTALMHNLGVRDFRAVGHFYYGYIIVTTRFREG